MTRRAAHHFSATTDHTHRCQRSRTQIDVGQPGERLLGNVRSRSALRHSESFAASASGKRAGRSGGLGGAGRVLARHVPRGNAEVTTSFNLGGVPEGRRKRSRSMIGLSPPLLTRYAMKMPGNAGDATPMNKLPGLYRAIVKSRTDPMNRGRVLVSIPAISAEPEWAALCVTSGRGSTVVMPDVGDEVIVGFADGDLRSPFCLGWLWGGQSPPISGSDRNSG